AAREGSIKRAGWIVFDDTRLHGELEQTTDDFDQTIGSYRSPSRTMQHERRQVCPSDIYDLASGDWSQITVQIPFELDGPLVAGCDLALVERRREFADRTLVEHGGQRASIGQSDPACVAQA